MKKNTKRKKRNIGQEILDAIDEIKAGKGKRYTLYSAEDISGVRKKLKLTQTGFASMLGVSERTLQAWEQGSRHPSGAALALLAIANARPEVIKEVLKP